MVQLILPAFILLVPVQPGTAPNPALAAQHNRLADAAMTTGRPDLALEEISEAIRLDPTNVTYRKKRGGLCLAFKNFPTAIADFTEAIRLQPGEADVYFYRGCCHNHPAPPDVSERAIADFTEAIRLQPNLVEAYRRRGDEYLFVQRDYARAVADYDRGIRLQPTYQLYMVRAMAHQNLQEDHEKAIADLTAALRLAPNLPVLSCLRGISHRKTGKLQESIVDLDRAITLDPEYGYAFQQRSEAHAALGDMTRAAEDRARAQTLPLGPTPSAARRGMPVSTPAPMP